MEWTGARYADAPTAVAETWIDAPPERVWEVVSDITLMPSMSTELQSSDWLDGDGPALGNTFVGRNKHAAMGEWETVSRVVECEKDRVFGWDVQGYDEPGSSWRFTLEPENGGTRLRQWMRLGPGRSGLSHAIERMPDKEQKIVFVRMRELESSIIRTLEAVKDRAENSG
jgi:uncharacterized protein YndB with AHSA1/START domain